MTSPARRIAKDLMPPALVRALARRSSHDLRFIEHPSWEGAVAASDGYGTEEILAKVEQAAADVINGKAAFERDGVLFDEYQYRWPVVAALMWQAARDGGALRVMDVGGSLGSVYRQYRRLLSELQVTWGVVEQPRFVAAGKQYEDDRLQFFDSTASCIEAISPRVGLLSSVLQYLPQPHDVLREVGNCGVEVIVIDRTPMTNLPADRAAVQVVPSNIYSASYPAWLLSRARILDDLRGWELVDTFPGIEPDTTSSAGTDVRWLGMTLHRS